ncbi:MAG: DUF3619 family protein [Rubrivivax sp.]|nr:DUF3619 family protein [Rubrivivax sp.]
MTGINRTSDNHALEARLGLRLAGGLTAHAEGLPHEVSERLRFARERALARARETLAAPGAQVAVGVSAAGGLVLGSLAPWLQRAASVLPLLVLLGGLLVIEQWSMRERVRAAAEIDTLLLADALPPNAYSDPGFAEFLRSEPQPW